MGEPLNDRLVESTVKFGRRECDDVGLYVLGRHWICNQD